MKIVHFSKSDFRGATARGVLALHRALLAGGIESRFFAQECFLKETEQITSLEPELLTQLTQTTYFDNNLTNELASRFTLGFPSGGQMDASAVASADIIHLHDIKGLFSPQTVARLLSLGKPVVWSLSDMWAFTGGCHHALDCVGYKNRCRNCPQIKQDPHGLPSLLLEKKRAFFSAPNLHPIASSNWIRECASASGVFGPTPLQHLPPVAWNELPPLPKHEAKMQLGLDPEVFTLLVLCENTGREQRRCKGMKQLLESCSHFNILPKLARQKKLCLLTLGALPEDWKLDYCTISGGDAANSKKLALFLSAADLAVLPHFEENGSLAVQEAAACGVPVIAMSGEGAEECIRDGVSGKLVPVGDLRRMAEEISYAALHQNMRAEWAKNSASTLLQGRADALERHMELYRQLPASPALDSAALAQLGVRDTLFDLTPALLHSVAWIAQAPRIREEAALENVRALRQALTAAMEKLATAEQRIQRQLQIATYDAKIEKSVISIRKLRKFLSRVLSEKEARENVQYFPSFAPGDTGQASFKTRKKIFVDRMIPWMYKAFLQERHIAKPAVFEQYSARPMSLEKFPRPRLATSKLPTIAIVTPSYMQGRFVEQTLLSVIDQGYPKLRYAVQDAGSIDETVDILKKHSSRITSWVSEPDTGQARAIASGFEKISGDVMAWLNSDDLLMPGALRFVGEYFCRHPEVDAIYGHRVTIDESGREIGRWVLPPHDPEVLASYDYVPQETLFWRASLWRKAGGISPNFRFALDWDLLLRFQQAGANIVRVPYYLGCFRVHTLQKTSAQMETIGNQEVSFLRLRTPGAHTDPAQLVRLSQRVNRESAFCEWLLRHGVRW